MILKRRVLGRGKFSIILGTGLFQDKDIGGRQYRLFSAKTALKRLRNKKQEAGNRKILIKEKLKIPAGLLFPKEICRFYFPMLKTGSQWVPVNLLLLLLRIL